MPPGAELRSGLQAFVAALVTRDLDVARGFVTDLRRAGTDVEAIYTELLAPSLRQVGELWASGAISVAQEHVASSLVEELMAGLYPDIFVAPRASRERVLVAAPEGERHVIGLRMAADMLQGRGFDVVFLGADTPRDDLVEAFERYSARLGVLAAYTREPVETLGEVAKLLLAASPRPSIVAGGAARAIDRAVGAPGRVEVVEQLADVRPAVERILAGGSRAS